MVRVSGLLGLKKDNLPPVVKLPPESTVKKWETVMICRIYDTFDWHMVNHRESSGVTRRVDCCDAD